MYLKPSLTEFTTLYPSYADPEFQDTLQEVLDEAYCIWGELIGCLPLDCQNLAFKYAVCHLFQMQVWEACGYGGSAPAEIKSRNDQVRFTGSRRGLNATACGQKLQALIKSKKGSYVYIPGERSKYTPDCGCQC